MWRAVLRNDRRGHPPARAGTDAKAEPGAQGNNVIREHSVAHIGVVETHFIVGRPGLPIRVSNHVPERDDVGDGAAGARGADVTRPKTHATSRGENDFVGGKSHRAEAPPRMELDPDSTLHINEAIAADHDRADIIDS